MVSEKRLLGGTHRCRYYSFLRHIHFTSRVAIELRYYTGYSIQYSPDSSKEIAFVQTYHLRLAYERICCICHGNLAKTREKEIAKKERVISYLNRS